LLKKAAAIKAAERLSLADSWIAATAIMEEAILVHKDPKCESLQCSQMVLPLKKKKGASE